MSPSLLRYYSSLPASRIVLWCYLIWYGITVFFHFELSIATWLNALGISVIIGLALMLSVARSGNDRHNPWQTFRLFLIPFCVSSFSALIKGKGFFLVFSPNPIELTLAVVACLIFVFWVLWLKRSNKESLPTSSNE